MRILFALIVLAHGLIHLMGFAKAFKLAEAPQLSGQFTKAAGVAWLFSALLFVAAMCLFLLKKDNWWMLAAPAVVLSQILIFFQWNDAKFGTIANLIALIGVILAFATWNFNSMVSGELKSLLPATLPTPTILTKEMTAPLPAIVQRWLEHSNAIGKEIVHVVHLRQKGEMKTKPESDWIPFEAEQFNTVDQPGFIWTTNIQVAPGIHLVGRDKYADGRGNMLIRLMGLFPVANAKGPQIDQGTLLRNLAEICWFPSAALSNYIQWEQTDSLTAKATMTFGGISASGVFRFNADGDMLGFETQRYYDRKEGATLENWLVVNKAWKDINDIRIPYESEITWKLKTGEFTWLKLEVTDIDYNQEAF
jgi:hypothetical protein